MTGVVLTESNWIRGPRGQHFPTLWHLLEVILITCRARTQASRAPLLSDINPARKKNLSARRIMMVLNAHAWLTPSTAPAPRSLGGSDPLQPWALLRLLHRADGSKACEGISDLTRACSWEIRSIYNLS